MRPLSLHVKVVRVTEWRWRLWLGKHLLRAAAVVMNCNVEIIEPETWQ